MSANSLTRGIIKYMNLRGYKVWRQNNMGVYDTKKQAHRKSDLTLKGVSDIIGYHKKTARFVCIEVKYGRDKMSLHQSVFYEDAKAAGAVAMVVKTLDEFLIKIKEYE